MTPPEFPGHELRQRREERGITPADIYRDIHIPLPYTEALETGNFDKLPGETYALGFLRTYCHHLDIDPGRYEDQLHACFRAQNAPVLLFTPAANKAREAKIKWMNEALAWGAICAILTLGWLTYSAMIGPIVERAQNRVDAGARHESPAPEDTPPF